MSPAENKIAFYRRQLAGLAEWDTYLLQESGLPGPRGNIELARAVAEEGDAALFARYLAVSPEEAPANSPGEFLPFCGALGLGKLLAEGQLEALGPLRAAANDPRWRMREAVAMALQRWGGVDMASLLAEMARWSEGTLLEKRAAAAALCEPALLRDEDVAGPLFAVLDRVTEGLAGATERRSPQFQALRQGLGYCWSVAVAAFPVPGKTRMEAWLASTDPDVRWVLRENLRKKRLERLDAAWVAKTREKLAAR